MRLIADSQVEYLRCVHHIYMVNCGRINSTGLNTKNISYVAKAIKEKYIKLYYAVAYYWMGF
jgi:aspartate/tyrosine/aromatic aminotransferase